MFNLLFPATISSGVIYDSAPNFLEFSITFSFGTPTSGSDDQDTKTDDGGKYDGDTDPTDTTNPSDNGGGEDNNDNSDQKEIKCMLIILEVFKLIKY